MRYRSAKESDRHKTAVQCNGCAAMFLSKACYCGKQLQRHYSPKRPRACLFTGAIACIDARCVPLAPVHAAHATSPPPPTPLLPAHISIYLPTHPCEYLQQPYGTLHGPRGATPHALSATRATRARLLLLSTWWRLPTTTTTTTLPPFHTGMAPAAAQDRMIKGE